MKQAEQIGNAMQSYETTGSTPQAMLRSYANDWVSAWDRFWFQPAQPHTLCLIRVLAGAMLLYSHLVWTLGLNDFLGPNAWIDRQTAAQLSRPFYSWSPLFYFDSPLALGVYHTVAVLVMAALFVGWRTRTAAVLAWLFAVSYCHRLQGALFGLDQAITMIAMYLMIGPSGAVYSVDRWLAKRRGAAAPSATSSANVAIRLIQIHLCVIYLFSAIAKMKGDTWSDGSAIWYAVANLEYQSFDLTWIARFPWLIALTTHATIYWELTYAGLIWPKTTRPIMLAMAVAVHGGIALAMGMITFGLAMLIANVAFVPPNWTQAILAKVTRQGDSMQPAGPGS